MQIEGFLQVEPAAEAVSVAAVHVRRPAARELDLKARELLKPCESLNFQTWSPIWKGSTQIGQLPLFSSDTTLLSKAWEVEREIEK